MAFKLPFTKDSVNFPHEQKQRMLLIVFFALLLVAFLVVYFGFLRAPATTSVSSSTDLELARLEEALKKMNFDTSFFKDPQFKNLKWYGEWPLEIKEKGRLNPFLPY